MNDIQNQTAESIITRNGTSALNKIQASSELNISRSKLDELRKSGELKYKMVGGQVRISAYNVAEMVA